MQLFPEYAPYILLVETIRTRFCWLTLGNFPSLWFVQKENRPEKFPFTKTNCSIVLAVQKSVKYLFAPNSLLFRKSGWEEKKRRENCFSIYAFQANAINYFHNACLFDKKIYRIKKQNVKLSSSGPTKPHA